MSPWSLTPWLTRAPKQEFAVAPNPNPTLWLGMILGPPPAVSATHLRVLETLIRRPTDTGIIDPDVLEELRRWRMLMSNSLEVTGMGRSMRIRPSDFYSPVKSAHQQPG